MDILALASFIGLIVAWLIAPTRTVVTETVEEVRAAA